MCFKFLIKLEMRSSLLDSFCFSRQHTYSLRNGRRGLENDELVTQIRVKKHRDCNSTHTIAAAEHNVHSRQHAVDKAHETLTRNMVDRFHDYACNRLRRNVAHRVASNAPSTTTRVIGTDLAELKHNIAESYG
jgi:hypothetical protein